MKYFLWGFLPVVIGPNVVAAFLMPDYSIGRIIWNAAGSMCFGFAAGAYSYTKCKR